MIDRPPKLKVLVDWDNDGYIQEFGASGQTNLIQSPFFPGSIKAYGTDRLNSIYFSDTPNIDSYGFIDRRIDFSTAAVLRMGVELQEYQWNRIIGKNIINGWTLSGINIVGDKYFDIDVKPFGNVVLLNTATDLRVGHNGTSYGGISISASTLYTFIFWHKHTAGSAFTPTYTITGSVSGDLVSTTPSAPNDTWSQVILSIPSTSAQNVQLRISSSTGTIGTLYTTGFMVLVGDEDTNPPQQYIDSTLLWGSDQFVHILEDGKTYTLGFRAKSPATITQITINVYHADLGTATETLITSVNRTISTTYSDISIPIGTPSGSNKGWYVTITANGSGFLDIKGFVLAEGSVVNRFNVSSVGLYDDITDYVLSVEWKSGRNDFYDTLAYEGTADILLNNDSRIFSPKNMDSPIQGLLKQNVKVIIKIQYNNSWYTMWSGWTDTFETTPGRTTDRQATISCKQGLFRLREGEFSVPLLYNSTLKDVVLDIVSDSGWRGANNPYNTILDYGFSLDENAYVSDVETNFALLEDGINTFELIGSGWSRDTNLESALKEALEAEDARLWIDREGSLNLANRLHSLYNADDIVDNIVADRQVTKSNYVFGNDTINKIEVRTSTKKETSNATVWKTRGSIVIPTKSTIIRELDFNFEEGSPKTVLNVTTEGMTLTASTVASKVNKTTSETIEQKTVDSNIFISILNSIGNKRQLKITNQLDYEVALDIELKGDYLEGGGLDTSYVYEDQPSFVETNAIRKEDISSNIITEEYEAAGIALSKLQRISTPRGEFDRITIKPREDADILRLLSLTIGDLITVSEKQTGEVLLPHIIIGEEFSFNGNILEGSFILAKLDETTYGSVGDTIVSEYINLIRHPISIQSRNNSYVDGNKLIAYGSAGIWLIGANKNMTRYIPTWPANSSAFYTGAASSGPAYLQQEYKDYKHNFDTTVKIRATTAHSDLGYYCLLEQVDLNSADKVTDIWFQLIAGKRYKALAWTRQIDGTLQASSLRLRYNTTTYLLKVGGGDATVDLTPAALRTWEKMEVDFDAKRADTSANVTECGIILDTAITSNHNTQFGILEIWSTDGAENVGETEIPVIDGVEHTLIIRAKLQDGEASETYNIKVFDQDYNQLASTTQTFNCFSIIEKTLAFTPSGDDYVFIELSRSTVPDYKSVLELVTIAIVTGTTIPEDLTVFNTGALRIYV